MVIKETKLERIPSQDSVLTISKSGVFFSAVCVRKYGLLGKEGISFLHDDEDPYLLGFRFHASQKGFNMLAIQSQSRGLGAGGGFFIKATELISKNPILKRVQSLKNKSDRTFEIFLNKTEDYYYIYLKPVFELSATWVNRNKINDDARGIYRYIDKNDQILYIGKGLIKQRASDAERANWGIDKIEYSVIEDENKALEWESYYIDLYVTTNGLRPPFNRIKGHSIKE